MTLGFYPGCSLKGSSREYAESVLAVAKAFDINLEEINDWNCCGATAAHNMNKVLSAGVTGKNSFPRGKAGIKGNSRSMCSMLQQTYCYKP